MASAGRLGNSASPFQMAHVSKSYYVPQTNQAYGEYSRSTPQYRPGVPLFQHPLETHFAGQAYSTADVHQPDGRFRENVGTRWGSSGPRVEARDLKIQKVTHRVPMAAQSRRKCVASDAWLNAYPECCLNAIATCLPASAAVPLTLLPLFP